MIMIDKIINEKINSQRAAEIFNKLYGLNNIDASRKRYVSLAQGAIRNNITESEIKSITGPLRVFTAPGRTELAGNHTDHNCGKVLAASIQLDSAAVVYKRNDNIVFFRSTGFPDVEVKLTDSNGAPDLQPKPEEKGKTEALIRGIAAEFHKRSINNTSASKEAHTSKGMNAAGGFSANADSIVLPGSGLSSSAALEVLVGRIFDSLYGEGKRAPLEIAQIGQIAENVYFGKPCGLMDQTACAAGGAVAIDFADNANPLVKQISFDPASVDYTLCVVNTGGSHADLTADYTSIPKEMKAVAAFFGKSVLREIEKETVINRAAEVRKTLGDRALLRAIHFFDENERVDKMSNTLQEMEDTKNIDEKKAAFYRYLKLVNESGDSSWKLLQNIYSPNNPSDQGISAALALTKNFLEKKSLQGACRVHGGGFAGTIQVYIPLNALDAYASYIESIFGAGSVTPLRIRPVGAVELMFD